MKMTNKCAIFRASIKCTDTFFVTFSRRKSSTKHVLYTQYIQEHCFIMGVPRSIVPDPLLFRIFVVNCLQNGRKYLILLHSQYKLFYKSWYWILLWPNAWLFNRGAVIQPTLVKRIWFVYCFVTFGYDRLGFVTFGYDRWRWSCAPWSWCHR